jgi:uncharacterized PurR-regulated membrane protein YhhQ (DUF165 family)
MPHDAPLPSQQHEYPGLPRLDEHTLHRRRETVFLVLAGFFLGTLAMLNILGITKFIPLLSYTEGSGLAWGAWGGLSFAVAVGVLPYPITFLCTDFISELFGRRRASLVVWVGLGLNIWVLTILWLGSALPLHTDLVSYGHDVHGRIALGPPLPAPVYNDAGAFVRFDEAWTFERVRQLTFGAVAASMFAYLAAQFVDVYLFHFWKRLTKNRHLWLRNNGSTLVSQLVDSVAVILITYFFARALPEDESRPLWPQLWIFIATGYVFKAVAALADTVPFYIGTVKLARYMRLPPPHALAEHDPRAAVESGVG